MKDQLEDVWGSWEAPIYSGPIKVHILGIAGSLNAGESRQAVTTSVKSTGSTFVGVNLFIDPENSSGTTYTINAANFTAYKQV